MKRLCVYYTNTHAFIIYSNRLWWHFFSLLFVFFQHIYIINIIVFVTTYYSYEKADVLKCSVCSFYFHLIFFFFSSGERPYRCHLAECGRAFIQLSNLQQHLRNHDAQVERAKNRPFHCTICGKGFATESSLRTHAAKVRRLFDIIIPCFVWGRYTYERSLECI